ncbi:MAG: hypothetical protein AB1427_03295 [Thermodesulfobacteriota bacterium]
METQKVFERIDQQIAEANRQYGLPAEKLKCSIHIFKPDSAKLETVVAVDIGLQDRRTRLKSSIRSFYSPGLYRYDSPASLEKDIQAYLTRKKIKSIPAAPPKKTA